MTDTAKLAAASFASEVAPSARVPATRSFKAFTTTCFATLLVSFGLIWAYVAACPIAFLDRDYPLWIAKRTMLDECQLGSVAVFGDSQTVAGIMPQAMSIPVTNFALSGTSPIETFFAVRRALRCHTPPRLVVIAHGASKFTGDSDYWRFGARTGFFSYDDMHSVERDADRLHDSSLEDLQYGDHLLPWLRDWLYSVRFPTLYFNSLVHGYIAGRWRHNAAAYEDNLKSSGHALFGTAEGSSDIVPEATAREFKASPLIDLYFTRTLALLAEQHIPVLILPMPINHATYMRSQPQLRDQFAAYLQTQARSFDNVILSGPPITCWPDAFYGDAWHFNAAGAEAFSRQLDVFLAHILAGTGTGPLPGRCG